MNIQWKNWFGFGLVLAVILFTWSAVSALPRYTISYQGYLKDGDGKPVTAPTNLVFSFYSSTSGVNPIWQENHTVTPQNGVYSLELGSPNMTFLFLQNYRYWLGVKAGNDPELRPLQPVTNVPYAYRAMLADGLPLDSVTSANLGDGAVTTPKLSDSAVTTLKLSDGAVTSEKITGPIDGAKLGPHTHAGGDIISGTLADARLSANVPLLSGGVLNLPSNGLVVGTNQLVVKGGKVGVGTSSPAEQLEITGNLKLPETTGSSGIIKMGSKPYIHSYLSSFNFFAGAGAGNFTMTGGGNTACGADGLASNTTGTYNTAVGGASLSANTTGSRNATVGAYALLANTEGEDNTAGGYQVLAGNKTGSRNTAFGSFALNANTVGLENTAVGYGALQVTTGSYNTATGTRALAGNTTGDKNTAVGADALKSQYFWNKGLAWNSLNTAVGYAALANNNSTAITNGIKNTAVGAEALTANSTGYGNTALGARSLYTNDTGIANTASGQYALYSNQTGSNNTATGSYALYANSTGGGNTATGADALHANDTGVGNAAFGQNALAANVDGNYNSASGALALSKNSSGGNNVATGYAALKESVTGNQNTALGSYALGDSTSGLNNIAVGFNAGKTLTTGTNNIYIGTELSAGTAAESQTIRVGTTSQIRTYIAGIYGTTVAGSAVYVNASGLLGTLTSSRRYKEDIADMGSSTSALMTLRPVSFFYKPEYADGPRVRQYGLIAEEVAEVLPDLVQYNDRGEPNSVAYQFVNAMLLNEVQKQYRELAEQRHKINALEERLARLEALLGGNWQK